MSALVARRAIENRRSSRPRKCFNHRPTRMSDRNTSPPSTSTGGMPYPRSTPNTKTESTSKSRYGLDDIRCKAQYPRYEREFQGHWVGPVEVPTFMDLLPKTKKTMPAPDKDGFSKISFITEKEELYKSLVCKSSRLRPSYSPSQQQQRLEGFIQPKFRLDINSDDVTRATGSKHPDLMLFPKRVTPATNDKSWADMAQGELCIVVKSDNSRDPFIDSPVGCDPEFRTTHQFTKHDDEHRETLGQLVSHATEACALQHRQFYYTVLITHLTARFIRWDRSGAIVSRSFDYTKNSTPLCEFFWRFTCGSRASRGFDPMVTRSGEKDEAAFKSQPDLAEWYEPGNVLTMNVWDEETEKYRRFLVSRPVVVPSSMTGRGTRGYWAIEAEEVGEGGEGGDGEDGEREEGEERAEQEREQEEGKEAREDKKEKDIVFVKDTWRPAAQDFEPEGNIIRELLNKGVPNVPDLCCFGHVPNKDGEFQVTQTHKFVARYQCGTKHNVAPYAHYRLVSKTVGYSLEHVKDSRQLLTATRDAFQGLIYPS